MTVKEEAREFLEKAGVDPDIFDWDIAEIMADFAGIKTGELATKAASEIHIAEVQRDEARLTARGVILDLISERSVEELECWLCGPIEFKKAVLARLESWRV